MSREQKMKQGGHGDVCLTQVPPSTFLHELLSLYAVPELHLLSKTTDHLHFFIFERGQLVVLISIFQLHIWAGPMTTNLARILHLHNEDWIRNSRGNPSLQTPPYCVLPQRNLGSHLNSGYCNPFLCSNKCPLVFTKD